MIYIKLSKFLFLTSEESVLKIYMNKPIRSTILKNVYIATTILS